MAGGLEGSGAVTDGEARDRSIAAYGVLDGHGVVGQRERHRGEPGARERRQRVAPVRQAGPGQREDRAHRDLHRAAVERVGGPRREQHRLEPGLGEARVEPLRERPRLQADAGQRQTQLAEETDERLRLAGDLGLTHNPPRRVDHAHAAPFQRDVDPGKVLHGCSPMMPGADPFGPRYTPSLWGQPPLPVTSGPSPLRHLC